MNTRHMKHILVALSATLVAGCATTTTKAPERPTANVEIQEEVGFTITEEARIGGDVRADYEEALSYLQQGRHDEGIALLERVAEAASERNPSRTACQRMSTATQIFVVVACAIVLLTSEQSVLDTTKCGGSGSSAVVAHSKVNITDEPGTNSTSVN